MLDLQNANALIVTELIRKLVHGKYVTSTTGFSKWNSRIARLTDLLRPAWRKIRVEVSSFQQTKHYRMFPSYPQNWGTVVYLLIRPLYTIHL